MFIATKIRFFAIHAKEIAIKYSDIEQNVMIVSNCA